MSKNPESLSDRLTNDTAFRKEFIANPKPILAESGVQFAPGTEVSIIESKPNFVPLIVGTKDLYTPEQLATMPPQASAVIKRSFVDSDFKSMLLQDPREAIYLETGYRVPESITIKTYESTDKHLYYPLVEDGAVQNEELSDLELEQVAGGKSSAGKAISHFFTSTVPSAINTVNTTVNNGINDVLTPVFNTAPGRAFVGGLTTVSTATSNGLNTGINDANKAISELKHIF